MKHLDYIKQETVTGTVPCYLVKSNMVSGTVSLQAAFNCDLVLRTGAYIVHHIFCTDADKYILLQYRRVLIECIPVFFSVRYGIDLWVWLRSVLGIKGVAILATVISMANFGWYAVDSQLFASSMINLFGGFGVNDQTFGSRSSRRTLRHSRPRSLLLAQMSSNGRSVFSLLPC